MLSAYHFGRHIWGMEMFTSDENATDTGNLWIDWLRREARNMTERDFAASPGNSNCYAKMMSGCACATRPIGTVPKVQIHRIYGL